MKSLAIAIPIVALVVFTSFIVYEETVSKSLASQAGDDALVVLASGLRFNGTHLMFRLVNNLDYPIKFRSITLISNSWGSITLTRFNGTKIVPARKSVVYVTELGSEVYAATGGREVKNYLVPVRIRVSYVVNGHLRYSEYLTYLRISAS